MPGNYNPDYSNILKILVHYPEGDRIMRVPFRSIVFSIDIEWLGNFNKVVKTSEISEDLKEIWVENA